MKKNDSDIVEIFTDGACSGNPGVGGYGAILRYKGQEKEISGFEPETTNNRMELMAVIRALESLNRSCQVCVVTDSKYVVKGITEWIHNWKRNSWKTAGKKDVLNKDLWQSLLELTENYDITWQWVRGHSGHTENEQCDCLAREAIDKCRRMKSR